jgi:Holliday junction resolvasome RuvABC endonuclease subunit
MKILALDLGTKTGYCYGGENRFECGTWTLAAPSEITSWGKSRQTRRGDPRVCRLLSNITELDRPDIIVFEDVQFSSTVMQCQLWASLRGAVWCAACVGRTIVVEAVPVGTLKKFATGNGAADKMAMRVALIARLVQPPNPNWDDNAIDAYWLYLWAQQNLTRTKI